MLHGRVEIGKQHFRKKSSEREVWITPTKRADEIKSWIEDFR